MTRRREPLGRPTRSDEWQFLAVSDRVAKDWQALCATAANAAANAWDAITHDPTTHSSRQHRLKGDLATGQFEGRPLPRWQYEVTAGGRIWYLADPAPAKARHPGRVLVEAVHVGHPKATE